MKNDKQFQDALTKNATAHVSREIAEAFGMEGLPNTIVHDERTPTPDTQWLSMRIEDALQNSGLDVAYIVRAVNAHEELLALVRDILAEGATDYKTRIEETIAKAEGK